MNKGDFSWLAVLLAISSILLIPASHEVFIDVTKSHPYVMGFLKFGILATMGELLAIRISGGQWRQPSGLKYRAVVWGLIGMLIVLMFEMFSSGVAGAAAKGLLWTGEGPFAKIMTPFLISAIMNLAFAPTFMIAHRISDTYVDLTCGEGIPLGEVTLSIVLARIDWQSMISFVVVKTIPFFWIPAHTIVFLLPPEYRVLVAAYLAIALGAILSYAKRGKLPSAKGLACKQQ